MRETKKQLNLQFFAEGAPAGEGGGEGAAPGVEAVAAGQQQGRSLEELGVPKQLAEKHRAKKGNRRAAAPAMIMAEQSAAPAEAQGQAAAAEAGEQGNSKLTWDEILKDEGYNREMQRTVNQRLDAYKKRNGDAAAGIEAMGDIIGVLGAKYGIDVSDPARIDFAALNKAFTEDTSHYRERAAELGTDVKTAMKMDQLERAEARRQRQEQESIRDQKAREHFAQLQRESAELKKIFPDFDLETEIQNPTFRRLTAPGGGLNVEQAYRAIHYKDVGRAEAAAVARATAQAISNSIQSGQRPRENGAAGRSSAPVGNKPYSQWTAEERQALKDEIRFNGARGMKTPLRR